MFQFLRKIEHLIEGAFSRSPVLADGRVEPLDLVRQIEREIEDNKRVFINGQVFVAHKLVIHLYTPSQARLDEYEALFNDPEFRQYIEDYIADRGYKLKDRIRVVIQCHSDLMPQFRNTHCWVEFTWPQTSGEPGEVTVVFDPRDASHIAAFNQPVPSEIPDPAWLEVLAGKAYNGLVMIRRREFLIGRTENVLDNRGEKLLRVNHLAFRRADPGDAVNASVSRRHARIVWRGGKFLLEDSGSQNGTLVERGTSVILCPPPGSSAEPIELEDGDVLVLGRSRVRFHLGNM